MCDPVSASLIAAGTAASTWATNNQSKASNRNAKAVQTAKEGAYRQGIQKQDGFANEARTAFNNRPSGATQFTNDANTGTAERLRALGVSPMGDYEVAASTPKNVMLARERIIGEADAKTNANNNAIATLSGYDDARFKENLSDSAFNRAFGGISDRAGREMRLTPLEMEAAANRAFKAPNSSLSLAKSAGELAMLAGASGAGKGASKKSGWVDPKDITMNGYDPNLPWKPAPPKIGGF